MVYLLLFDFYHIHGFIFATNKLKEMRGASKLLDELNGVGALQTLNALYPEQGNYSLVDRVYQKNELTFQEGLRWEVIYLGGGSGKIIFRYLDDAKKFGCDFQSLVLKTIKSANIAFCIEKWNSENFKEVLDRAEKNLKEIKTSECRLDYRLHGLYLVPCELCGQESASYDHEKGLICANCKVKIDAAAQSSLYSIENKKLPEELFLEDQRTKPLPFNLPDEIEQIGAQSRPEGYVALIYADGNSLGKKLKRLLEPDQNNYSLITCFSETVDNACRHAAYDAVAEILETDFHSFNHTWPVQFIMAGGDDLILIVPAQYGAKIAISLMEKASKYFSEGKEEKFSGWQASDRVNIDFSLSAGMIIAKDNYPIREMVDRAYDLLKSAKKPFSIDNTAAIDFQVIKSSAVKSIPKLRESDYSYKLDTDEIVKLYARPYNLAAFKQLVETIKKFKKNDFPNNKLSAFYQSLFAGKAKAMFECIQLLERLSKSPEDNSPKQIMLEYIREENLTFFPWREEEDNYFETPMLDLIELYEFIK